MTLVELIHEEKGNGKSILMSSHMFDEIEGTCDRIGMIKAVWTVKSLSSRPVFSTILANHLPLGLDCPLHFSL